MCKKLCLLSCVLVVSLAVAAIAEDLEIPAFAGAAGSCAIWWNFEEPFPNADDWIYTPDLEPEFAVDEVLLDGGGVWGDGVLIWPTDEEVRFLFTMPQGTGDYFTAFVQITYRGAAPEEIWGFPEGWTVPPDAGGDHLGEGEGIGFDDPCEIEPNVFYVSATLPTWNMEGEDPAWATVAFWSTTFTIEQIVIDAIRHPNPFPPAGPGRRIFRELLQVSNISPAEAERHAPIETNLSFQAPEEALCIDPNADPNLKGPFEYDVYFGAEPNVLTMTQLADACMPANCNDVMVFDPCAGDLNYATTYYWRVDFNDTNGGGDPCFYEGPYSSFTTIGLADNVSPADGAADVSVYADLAWTGDSFADDFDVYFSTNVNDVNDGTASMGNQGPNTYPLGDLVLGTDYFWRIDQVNDTLPLTIKGAIWSFTTDIATEVDSMDSYDSSNEIFYTWLDSFDIPRSHAVVGLETAEPYVQDGNAMSLTYDNVGKEVGQLRGSWTEAEVANLPVGSNWNAIGGKALQIWFRGTLGNSVTSNDKMYIALDDGSTIAASVYPDINDANVPLWQEWNIDLAQFADAGVNLSNVSKIHIGFGGQQFTGQSVDGGQGAVYFDNFALFTTRCVQAEALGDATGDCTVNTEDILSLQEGWLQADYEVPPEEPNRAGLMVEYLFDTAYEDTSTNGRTGIPGSFASVSGGYLSLTGGIGGENKVEIPLSSANPFDGSQDYTISFELKSGATTAQSILFSSSDVDANDPEDPNHQATHPFAITFELSSGTPDSLTVFHDNWWVVGGENTFEPGDALINEWQHVAVTYDADGGICPDWGDEYGCPPDTVTGLLTLYVNGVPPDEALNFDPNIPEIDDDSIWIGDLASSGYKSDVGYVSFIGNIDNVRIYDSALPHSNIMWLAGKPVPTYFPLEEVSNLYPKIGSFGFDPNNVDIVDFKDFAVIADHWLEGPTLWP